jgi:hypothetical protein
VRSFIKRQTLVMILCPILGSFASYSQTTVTTSGGTTNTIPLFTGSSMIGNSVITQSSGNIGIDTSSPVSPLDVSGYSFTTQSNIAVFVNGTNSAYTSMTGVGSASIVNTWSNGSQVLEFVPFSSGNGVMSAYTGSLLFQTNYRTNQMAITSSGNVGIGTTSPGATLEVNGNARVDGSLQLGSSGIQVTSGGIVFPNGGGTQTAAWTGVICGGDFAESVDVNGDRARYEPGDVLVLTSDGKGDVGKSSGPYSTLVAGIYSTKPGTVGRRQITEKRADEIPMAMVGIVPTKVSAENGPIRRGDLLVTASLQGYAMKGTDRNKMLGAVIGKAMGSLESGTGVIEVLVTLQ